MPHFTRVNRKTAVNFDMVSVIEFNEKGKIVDEENEVYTPTARLLIPDEHNQILLTGHDATFVWDNILVHPDSFARIERRVRRLMEIISKVQHQADRVFARLGSLDPWPGAEDGPQGWIHHEAAKTFNAEVVAELKAAAESANH